MSQILQEYNKLPAEQRKLVDRYRLQDIYKNDLFKFAKICLGYTEMTERTHGPICEILQNDSQRKLIVCPRGSFKSSLGVVAFCIWKLINNPNERIMIDSEVFTNSSNFIREIKGHMESPRLVNLFGNFKTQGDWTQSSLTIAQRTKNYKESSIVASGVGAIKTGQHFSIIVGDDLNSHKNSNSPDLRKKVIDHYRYYTSLLEPNGTIVIIGTRYASDDVIGYILDNEISEGVGRVDSNASSSQL